VVISILYFDPWRQLQGQNIGQKSLLQILPKSQK